MPRKSHKKHKSAKRAAKKASKVPEIRQRKIARKKQSADPPFTVSDCDREHIDVEDLLGGDIEVDDDDDDDEDEEAA